MASPLCPPYLVHDFVAGSGALCESSQQDGQQRIVVLLRAAKPNKLAKLDNLDDAKRMATAHGQRNAIVILRSAKWAAC